MARRGSRWTIATFSVLLLLLGGATAPARAEGLSDAEFGGYLTWLQSLVGRAPAEDGLAGTDPLYPFDLAGDDEERNLEAGDTDVLIAGGRGLIDLERELRHPRARRDVSARDALHAARLYRHAAEYDSALAWYGRADALDTARELQAQITRESLAAAVALGDSAAVARRVVACVSGGSGPEETVIALRFLIAHRDDVNLQRLTLAVVAQEPQDPQLAVWLAYAHSTLGDWPACLARLRTILEHGAPDPQLNAPLRAWVLVAVPDMLFLAGDREGAGSLYRALAASEIPGVATWARLQVANLDVLGGRAADASAAFAKLCADEATGPWRAFACEMAKHSENLTRYGAEAKADDTAHDEQH